MKSSANWDKIRNRDTTAALLQNQANADAFTMKIGDIILQEIVPTLKQQRIDFSRTRAAKYLNDHGITTRRGGKWSTTQVSRLFKRLAEIKKRQIEPEP